jgi:hypothetical protein
MWKATYFTILQRGSPMSLRHIQASDEFPKDENRIKIFLGGSIEMGKADHWQQNLVDQLSKESFDRPLDLYNPRHNREWKTEWMNDYEPGTPFHTQVDWELRHQKDADLLLYYFAADTISPITLFELGLFQQQNPVIGMDPAYLRAGNLVVTKEHFDLHIHTGWDDFYDALVKRIRSLG